MKCEIIGEQLIVIPDNHTEVYAISKWLIEHPLNEIDIDKDYFQETTDDLF